MSDIASRQVVEGLMASGMRWPPCQFYVTPDAAERTRLGLEDPDIVIGCPDSQGEGPLYFFVPVHGGAVRVAVCEKHAALLQRYHGSSA